MHHDPTTRGTATGNHYHHSFNSILLGAAADVGRAAAAANTEGISGVARL
jgi:hypothetical protein